LVARNDSAEFRPQENAGSGAPAYRISNEIAISEGDPEVTRWPELVTINPTQGHREEFGDAPGGGVIFAWHGTRMGGHGQQGLRAADANG
jgi:hypothetical protein